MVVDDPISLELGRSALHVFLASKRFFGGLRLRGCTQICINLMLQDGALIKPMARAHHAKHALQYHDEFEDLENKDLLCLLDWTIAWKCTNHGGSNAISNGLYHIKNGGD